MKKDTDLAGCVGLIVLALVSIVYGTVLGGFGLTVLWKWFVMPLFDVPLLSITQAIGLSLVWGYMNIGLARQEVDKDNTDSVAVQLITLIVRSTINVLLFLTIGWIITLFM